MPSWLMSKSCHLTPGWLELTRGSRWPPLQGQSPDERGVGVCYKRRPGWVIADKETEKWVEDYLSHRCKLPSHQRKAALPYWSQMIRHRLCEKANRERNSWTWDAVRSSFGFICHSAPPVKLHQLDIFFFFFYTQGTPRSWMILLWWRPFCSWSRTGCKMRGGFQEGDRKTRARVRATGKIDEIKACASFFSFVCAEGSVSKRGFC